MASLQRAHQLDAVLSLGEEWYRRLSWTRDEIRRHQELLLRRLLAHAAANSPFYAERLRGVDPSTFGIDHLVELPVMSKATMMSEFDRVVTDPRCSLAAVERHLACVGAELEHLADEFVVMASGGSSGTRGIFVYDDEGFTSYVLSLVRETLHTVRSLGITSAQPVTGAIVAAGSTIHATAAAVRLAGVAPSPVRMHTVPATLPIDQIIDRLQELQPLSLIAYGSVLPRLAALKVAGRLDIAPLVVSSTSEPFPVDARRQVEAAFGVPVGNTFGATEGLVGLAAAGEEAIRFAEDTCIVELVDDAGRPVEPGEQAAKVYVTNLVNLVQPLIRYELTDRFREVTGPWSDGYLRAVVDGRSDVPLEWGGVAIHPLAVRSVLVRHPMVSEYQVRQTTTGVDVAVVSHDGSHIDVARIETELGSALGVGGLRCPSATVRQVDTIPRDALSGKPRRFIPLG